MVSYATVAASLVYRSEYIEPIVDKTDLASVQPAMLTGLMNNTKLIELERSITLIELDREPLNTAHSTLSSKMKQVINATMSQS
jgi:hypothetical protein